MAKTGREEMKLTKEDFDIIDDRTSYGKYHGGRQIIIKTHTLKHEKELRDEIIQALEIKERLDVMIKKLDDIRECKDPKNVDSYGCLYVMMGCSCVPLSLFEQVRDGEEK